MGRTHARAFATLADVRVVAVSSRSTERAAQLAREVDATAMTDDAILDDPNIDAVSITLPTHLHRSAVIRALRAGKHVLVEKPFALTVKDCDAMIAAHVSQKSRRIFMVAHVLRFWPEYVALVNLVQSGELGKPISASAARLSVVQKPGSWFTHADQSGGAIMDLMIHDLDALNWIFGRPTMIYARGTRTKPGFWNHAHVVIGYGKREGAVEASHMQPNGHPFTMQLGVLCERGKIEFIFRAGGAGVQDDAGGTSALTVYRNGGAQRIEVKDDDAYRVQAEYFVACVRQHRQPKLGTPMQARLGVAMSWAARRSLETGRVVTL